LDHVDIRKPSTPDRSELRFPSDLNDQGWSLIEPLIPPAKPGGNRRTVTVRDVVDGVMYILSTGCQVVGPAEGSATASPVNDYFRRWDGDGTNVKPL
jgi:transposase